MVVNTAQEVTFNAGLMWRERRKASLPTLILSSPQVGITVQLSSPPADQPSGKYHLPHPTPPNPKDGDLFGSESTFSYWLCTT